jgi:hypothetical protein
MQMMTGFWWKVRIVCHQNEVRHLADLLGECVVEDQTVHASFACRHIIFPHRDFVTLAFSGPRNAL